MKCTFPQYFHPAHSELTVNDQNSPLLETYYPSHGNKENILVRRKEYTASDTYSAANIVKLSQTLHTL